MVTQHFKVLAEAIATIVDVGERERMAQLIGTVCHNANKNFSWFIWNEMCLVTMDDEDYYYDDFDDFDDYYGDDYYEDEYEDDYDYDYEDDIDEAWGNDHQEEQ